MATYKFSNAAEDLVNFEADDGPVGTFKKDSALWNKMVADGVTPDPHVTPDAPTTDEVYDGVIENQKMIKALALVILDEVNLLRAEAGLTARTTAQLRNAVESKYDAL